ncbi:MAG TPA: DUF5615 family PIN-like protein [Pyrinomonadaceae bacterium]|nr:DUF5615 family PIN-like protein [Pyrinomonadaceae bacterium]
MRVRFQADADLNQTIVLALLRREPGIDFQTALAARLAGLDDPTILALAAHEERVLVTHDQSTMPEHFSQFISSHTSSGLLIIPQHLAPSIAVEELLLVWIASEAEEWLNRIAYLPL